MGSYTQLFIDRLYLSWKNYVPSFLTFLFSPTNVYRLAKGRSPDNVSELGFRTTCQKAIESLENSGYSVAFFADVYSFFEKQLQRSYEDTAIYHLREESDLDPQSTFDTYLAKFPVLSAVQQLEDFVVFIQAVLRSDFQKPPFNQTVEVSFSDGKKYEIPPNEYLITNRFEGFQLIDFESLQMYVCDKPLLFPPWISKICKLFDDEYLFEYPEVISLMFVRIVLAGVPAKASIRLDLSDVLDFDIDSSPSEQKEYVKQMHTDLAYSLVEKVNLYNRVFKSLFQNEGLLRERYVKSEARDILKRCDKANSPFERGRALEQLIEIIFTVNQFMEIVNKRVSTGDEEIDLVIKNNIDRPFWNALHSPLFFVECKNWHDPVGSKELRDFEGKLRNHSRLVKVGFFVCLNGFTSEVIAELKRGSRDSQHLVLIQRSDIEEYINTNQEFCSWFEKKTSRLI